MHQLVTFGICVKERGGGCGSVGEFCFSGSSGPWVAFKGEGVEHVVGWNDGHALVGADGVDSVFCPGLAVVIDVQDEQAVSAQIFVPTFLLTVFEQIVFVVVAAVLQHVCDGL